MAKHPEERYADAGAFAAALAAVGAATHDAPDRPRSPSAGADRASRVPCRSGDRLRIPRERRPFVLAIALAALFAVVVARRGADR